MKFACRVGWHNWSEWEEFNYQHRGPSWPHSPSEERPGLKRHCLDCKIKIHTEDNLWDDRSNWFANDGIDYSPKRLEAV